jgi:nitrite reductase (NADH) small subunit
MPAKNRVYVAQISDIPSGTRKLITIDNKSIGVFNTGSQIVAILNICPHELAPVCLGKMGGTTLPSKPGEFIWGRENEIIRCPWHGWEFDLLTGDCLTDKRKIKHFTTVVEGEKIFIEV